MLTSDSGQKRKTFAARYAEWLFWMQDLHTNLLQSLRIILSYSVKSCLWDCTSQ